MNPSPNVEPVLLTGEPMPVVRLFSDRSLALTFGGQGMHFNPRQAAALMLAVLNEFEPTEGDVLTSTANDRQVGGEHYRSMRIQVWDAIIAWGLGFLDGNVVKYIARWRHKGGVRDLQKARHYLDKLLEETEAAAIAAPADNADR